MDPFGRTIDYLRISVTDRCNERCLYCMPEGYKGWSQRPDHLTAGEIIQVANTAARLGFRKFRLTGGEPLLRPDLVEIARGIGQLSSLRALGLSTNATLLAPVARDLRVVGMTSVNISLDALEPQRYQAITGGRFDLVMQGIDAAVEAGFEVVKLNTVLLRGKNEDQLIPLLHFAAQRDLPIRFIELMPLTKADVLNPESFLSVEEAMGRIRETGTLVPLPDYRPGHGPARYYRHKETGARVGFIGALTTPDFCTTCNKLRLTADGKIRPCLGRHGEIDLQANLRHARGDDLDTLLRMAIANKPENHEFSDCYEPGRPMTAIGG